MNNPNAPSDPSQPLLIRQNPPTDGAFTLTELAAVVAVLALLLLLLTPALARSRVGDHAFQCQNNLRQLINGWRMYAADNADRLPDSLSWMYGVLNYAGSADSTNIALIKQSLLWPYVNNLATFKCPADKSLSLGTPRTRTYSMNQQFRSSPINGHADSPPWRIYKKSSDMISPPPAGLWVILEESPDSINDAAFSVAMDFQGISARWQSMPASFHQGSCGFSFADGHTDGHKWKDRRTLYLVTYSGTFPFGIYQPNNPDIAWMQARTTTKY